MSQGFTNYQINHMLEHIRLEKPLFVGVGNGNVEHNPTFTSLQGEQKAHVAMFAGFPTVAGNVITIKAFFDEDTGNFHWTEWGLFDAITGGNMLYRAVENKGEKISGQGWLFEGTITVG